MTPHVSNLISELINELFEPNRVAIFQGDQNVAQSLLKYPFHHIFFVGSPSVGKIVMAEAAKHLSSITLELGGKTPTIIDKTANVKMAINKLAWGKCLNLGQSCISPDYILIHESKKNEFAKTFIEKTKKLKLGDGMKEGVHLGPITTKKRLEEIEKLVETTKKEGAKVLMGGQRPSYFNKGYFYEPTVFDNVKDDFTIMKVEPFGPLVPMLSFKSFDEVIERANNHELGLSGYVCTNSMEKAHLASEKLETGTVGVNTLSLIHI